jgi:hypothetical protein
MKAFRWVKERIMKVFRKKAESEPGIQMDFFNSAVTILETLVVALGAWGVVNLLEGYGNDNPGANAHVR